MDKNGIFKLHSATFCKHLYRRMNFASVQIPTRFLDRIKEEVPDTSILKGPWGGSWPVKVCQKKEGIFLVEGWEKFLSDHSLVSGGFLLFRYCGNWSFNVEIFGHDGLENMKIIDGREKSEAGPSGVRRKRGRPRICKSSSQNGRDSKSCAAGSGVKNKTRRRANWKDPELLEFFLDLCMEEAAIGRTEGGNLSRKSWDRILCVLKEEKGIEVDIIQLENRWSFLKRRYETWSKIIAQARNGQYDPVANKVRWNQQQWEEYLQIHADANVFRYKSLAYPEKMKLLFDCSL